MSDDLPVYALRVTEDARRQMDAEVVRLFDAMGEDAAVSWRDGLEKALASLATLPGRCPPASENGMYAPTHSGQTLRQLIYRRRGGPAWRLLFTVHAQTDTDPPVVRVHQVRLGAQPPFSAWPDAP